ncbi:MAG: hypothetical protein JW763_05475 [candidate division Zixibacteria bacterium]|nr:hypothetical protein [candidate division Zixibacteria bacterium]
MSRKNGKEKAYTQFEILRDIAIATSSDKQPTQIAEAALTAAMALIGLSAGQMLIWDDQGRELLTAGRHETEQEKKRLADLEHDLFDGLRKQRRLESAYLSFGGENPVAGFTLPLKKGNRIIGAVLGIQPGSGSLVREDEFLEALAAALTVSLAAAGVTATGDPKTQIRQERINAILETTATLNHEINNPLTAVLGNIQLLLMRKDKLDEELAKKLQVVEESALRIRTVMQKLLNINKDTVADYANGLKMIDLSDDEQSSS